MRDLFSQFWTLTGPYWRSEERAKSCLILLAVVVLNLGSVYIMVLINLWYALFYNALQNWDFAAFTYQILRFSGLAAVYIFAGVYQVYLRQMLQIRWRNWLTGRYVERWLQNGTFYRMQLSNGGADNPDQRIAEDINGFVGQTLILGLGVLESVVTLGSFAFILWELSGSITIAGLTIPGYMLWAAILYAIVGTWLTNRLGLPLVSLNFQQQLYEANLRFALVRLRENAEGVALYGGEEAEQKGIESRFSNVVSNWWGIMRRQKLLSWFSSGYTQIAIIFPFVVAAPRYFAGAFQLGELMQTAQAFGQVQTALSWFVTNYTSLAEYKATVNRLSGFEQALAATAQPGLQGLTEVKVKDAARTLGFKGEHLSSRRIAASHRPQFSARLGKPGPCFGPVGQRKEHVAADPFRDLALLRWRHPPACRRADAVLPAEALSAARLIERCDLLPGRTLQPRERRCRVRACPMRLGGLCGPAAGGVQLGPSTFARRAAAHRVRARPALKAALAFPRRGDVCSRRGV